MKTCKISIFMLLTAVWVTSCNNPNSNHSHKNAPIELNNGQKWTVNPEMTPYISEAEHILMEYNGKDFKALAEKLQMKNKGLIKSCTMEGKSHDELHKWLHPHMQLVEELEKATSKEDGDKIIEELKISFQTYHHHFE